MSKRKLLVLSLVALGGLLAAACGAAEFECEDALGCVTIGPDEAIHIGYMLPITGPAVVYAEASVGAMEVYLGQRGQVLDHDVLLTGEDTECSAEGGETAAQRTAADPTIVGVIGTTCSSAMTAAMTTMSESGLTMISPSNTSPALTNPAETWQEGYFRTAHNDLFQGAVAAQYAYNELGARTAAAIHDGDPYTEGLATAFTDNFTKLGGTVTTTEAVNKLDTDMRAVLTTVAADSPDVLFFPIFQPEADFIVAQSVEIPGLENTILFAADGAFVAPFAPSAGQAALGMYFSGPYVQGDKEDKFQADYLAAHGTVPPGPFGEHAVDGLGILLNAIEAVAVVDSDGTIHIGRQALRDAVEATTGYDGITGILSCGPKELVPGVTYRGDCATGEALGIFQANQAWIDSEEAYPPEVLWTP